MIKSVAIVPTSDAGSYLRKLCIHWEKRFNVSYDAWSGIIDFGDGQIVQLFATSESLKIVCTDTQNTTDRQLERITEEHISRFSRKKELVFDWRTVDPMS
ncbi:DUF2218 domain-containing protein [Gibbsiella quercinecans]|uniref:DUF2218 domain-containing protein n=1 Tax=Gibbsiella quercinecans TaxID=929813 RepID=UPI000EF1E506|nr:DUF2218 domain-containing protein [Gibbsiella quercinecans]